MLETYEAYADYEQVAPMTEELVAHVAEQTLGGTTVERDGETIDLTPPWRRVTLRDAILRARPGSTSREHRDRETLAAAMRHAGIDSPSRTGLGQARRRAALEARRAAS